LLAALDTPLAASSANFAGGEAPATLVEVDLKLLSHAASAFEDGPEAGAAASSPGGQASTVIDLRPLVSGDEPLVLREGAVPASEVLGLISACL
jgi:tRNA A37 threonylcarbamoyladenosine synthetase subunit TsaC/SUA5/YrdC